MSGSDAVTNANDNPDLIPDELVRQVWGIKFRLVMRQLESPADPEDDIRPVTRNIESDDWEDMEDDRWEKVKATEGAEIRKALLAIVTGE